MKRLLRGGSSSLLRISVTLLVIACGVFARTIALAVRTQAPPSLGRARTLLAVRRIAAAPSSPDDLLDDAVAVDPFQPNREPPSLRFGEKPESTSAIQQGIPTVRAEIVRLLGTVIDRNGGMSSFIVCQLDGAPARVVHAGEHVGTYRLRSIAQGSAVFEKEDGVRLELRVIKSGT